MDIAKRSLLYVEDLLNSRRLAPTFASDLPSTSSNLTSLLTEVLKPPKTFKRSKKTRNFKVKNYGVLTDGKLLERFEKTQAEKDKLNDEKEERRVARLERKKILNIKKEDAEERSIYIFFIIVLKITHSYSQKC